MVRFAIRRPDDSAGLPGALRGVAGSPDAGVDLSGVRSVTLLGVDGTLSWKQTASGMEITLPEKPDYGMAYPVRIAFQSSIPSITK